MHVQNVNARYQSTLPETKYANKFKRKHELVDESTSGHRVDKIAGTKMLTQFNGHQMYQVPTRFKGPVSTNGLNTRIEPDKRWKFINPDVQDVMVVRPIGEEIASKAWINTRRDAQRRLKENSERQMHKMEGVLPHGYDGIMGTARAFENLGGDQKRPLNRVHEIATAQPRSIVPIAMSGSRSMNHVAPTSFRNTATVMNNAIPIQTPVRGSRLQDNMNGSARFRGDKYGDKHSMKWNVEKTMPNDKSMVNTYISSRNRSDRPIGANSDHSLRREPNHTFINNEGPKTYGKTSGPLVGVPGFSDIPASSTFIDAKVKNEKIQFTNRLDNKLQSSIAIGGMSQPPATDWSNHTRNEERNLSQMTMRTPITQLNSQAF